MEKREEKEIFKMRDIGIEFTKQLFLDNGFQIKEETRKYRTARIEPDLVVEKNNKIYVVEVKRSELDTGKIIGISNILEEYTKETNYIPVLVLFSRRSSYIKERIASYSNINVIDISNLLYLVSKNEKMKNKLINLLSYSTENIIEKKLDFDIDLKQYQESKDSDYGYIEKLEDIIPGPQNFKQYQEFCVDILKYLFNDTLSLWEEQEKSNDDLFIFDLICKIKSDIRSEFFNTLENYFSSRYIIFEFKNYTEEITQKEIFTTEKYLYKTALRTVAIILTRKGVDKNGMKAIKGILRETGKLMIVLDDNDIKKMIYAKEHNEDYFEILVNKLDKMLISLEK